MYMYVHVHNIINFIVKKAMLIYCYLCYQKTWTLSNFCIQLASKSGLAGNHCPGCTTDIHPNSGPTNGEKTSMHGNLLYNV